MSGLAAKASRDHTLPLSSQCWFPKVAFPLHSFRLKLNKLKLIIGVEINYRQNSKVRHKHISRHYFDGIYLYSIYDLTSNEIATNKGLIISKRALIAIPVRFKHPIDFQHFNSGFVEFEFQIQITNTSNFISLRLKSIFCTGTFSQSMTIHLFKK